MILNQILLTVTVPDIWPDPLMEKATEEIECIDWNRMVRGVLEKSGWIEKQ